MLKHHSKGKFIISTINIRKWLQVPPEIETVFACVCDLNGTMCGKRLPIEKAKAIMDGGLRMPLSILSVDVWGKISKIVNWCSRLVMQMEFVIIKGARLC